MAIDYQQILLDMNRPHRRQGKSMKTILGACILMAAIFAGTFSAWKYGVVDRIVENVGTMAGNLLNRGADDAEPAVFAAAPAAARTDAALPERPVPLQSSLPVDIAAESSPVPAAPVQASAVQELQPLDAPRPVHAASPAEAQARMLAQGMRQAQTRQEQERERQRMQSALAQAQTHTQSSPARAAGPDMDPIPALSDARSQLKVIDQMLNSDPAEAMRRLDDLSQTALEPVEAAEVGYRRGYAARILRDEPLAERSWLETVDAYPDTRGGRFAALALADTWFQRYAGARAQLSYWDDMQLMYSRVLGVDDAPFLPEAKRTEVKARLNTLNDSLFFGSAPTKMARYHKIEQGELLGSIAQKYRVDYESIARINGINPNQIRAGMDIKIVVGSVDVVVRKNAGDPSRQPTLTWYLDGRWVREYPCCVGDGIKTPAGSYTFTSKERDPSWTNPANGQLLPNDHPENILGSRWMAMKGMNTQGLGVHGTTVDDSIPGYTSAGCVRLLNRDVEELFSYARIGGRVTILD